MTPSPRRLAVVVLVALLGGCTSSSDRTSTMPDARLPDLLSDPLLSLTFTGGTPAPPLRVNGSALPQGNGASITQRWDFAPGSALEPASVLARLRGLQQGFERVTCFPDGETLAFGQRRVGAAGATVYVTIDTAKRFVEIQLDGQPAGPPTTTPTPVVLGCDESVRRALR